MTTLGMRIKTARENIGMSQSELAVAIGIKPTSGVISNWERDLNKPDAEKIVRLCEVLDISASFLLDYYGKSTFEVKPAEITHIKKYRELDPHGKEMVDFTLQKEWERSTAEAPKADKVIPMAVLEDTNYVNAAHANDYAGAPEELKQLEEDIMDDDNF